MIAIAGYPIVTGDYLLSLISLVKDLNFLSDLFFFSHSSSLIILS